MLYWSTLIIAVYAQKYIFYYMYLHIVSQLLFVKIICVYVLHRLIMYYVYSYKKFMKYINYK